MRPRILHVTPGAGGDLGRVLQTVLAWQVDRGFAPSVLALDEIDPTTRSSLTALGIPWTDDAHSDLKRARDACLEADAVLLHWWNHPFLAHLLATGIPPVRLLVWSHVSGLVAPQCFTPELLGISQRFLFSSPRSLESPLVTAGLARQPVLLPYGASFDSVGSRLDGVLWECLAGTPAPLQVPVTRILEGGSLHDHLCLASYDPINRDRILRGDPSWPPEGFMSTTTGSPAHYHRLLGLDHPRLLEAAARTSSPVQTVRPCPLCGRRSGDVLGRYDWAFFDDMIVDDTGSDEGAEKLERLPSRKELVQCRCGMLFDDALFTEENLSSYYRSNRHYAVCTGAGGGGDTPVERFRNARIVDCLLPLLNEDCVLDFGCGRGGLLAEFMRRGIRAMGIEGGEASREVGRSSGLSIWPSLAEAPVETIGAVVLSHVLEHLLDPRTALTQLMARAGERVAVYIEVPDSEGIFLGEPRYDEYYFEHINHFTRASLASFAASCGVEILALDTIPYGPGRESTRCLALRGVRGRTIPPPEVPGGFKPLPRPGRDARHLSAGPVLLRGVPQYAQLIVGMCPDFARRISRIVDASSAKVGRSIRGIPVEPATALGALPDEWVIAVPKSPASEAIIDALHRQYPGHVVEAI